MTAKKQTTKLKEEAQTVTTDEHIAAHQEHTQWASEHAAKGKIMTDYRGSNRLKHDPDSNMRALKNAIFNSEDEKLQMLLTNLVFDEIQKGYLINLAQEIGNSEIVELLKHAPATP